MNFTIEQKRKTDMTVSELIHTLEMYPPLMEVYVQITSTGLSKVDGVEKDNILGIVELKWNTKNVMPPEPSVYPMEKPIDVFDIKPAPSSADVNWNSTNDTQSTSTLTGKEAFYGD